MEPAPALPRPTGMGRLFRAGSAASFVLLAGLLGGCGSADGRSAVDESGTGSESPSAAESDSRVPEASLLRQGNPMRCVHSDTVPAEDDSSPSVPAPRPEIDDPHFWFPFFVECDPAVSLDEAPRDVDQEPGIQPLS